MSDAGIWLTPTEVAQLERMLAEEPTVNEGLRRLLSYEPIWAPDVHGETDDAHTIEQAADRIEQKLRD